MNIPHAGTLDCDCLSLFECKGAGFPCPVPGCGRVFPNGPRRSEHMSWHRGETQCSGCGVRLTTKRSLRNHMVKCLGMLCPVPGCGRYLPNRFRRSEHLSWHRGETICTVCHQQFCSRTALRIHMRKRHGDGTQQL
ncbi:Zinc finger protein 410 [Amphibalanus amphitrite]|uniref:Zinc finger protein 410 n=1 Tax=Amphibalanus amphitrite TaxID=1232801 RepID=A0A6A4VJY8_AMPAM|nr:Zinc finger protein 410 [Amphibalanus amphitrite]